MSCCSEVGEDMSDDVLTQAIEIINRVNPLVINVSGGEPTLHNDLFHIIKRLQTEVRPHPQYDVQPPLILITNGTFYSDRRMDLSDIQRTGINIQITHDTRFYKNCLTPDHIDELKQRCNNKLCVETDIASDHITAYGNALTNNLGTSKTRIAPMCFNLRSLITLSGFDFRSATQEMEQRMKFCSWGIKPNGEIILSESFLCPHVGTITDSIQTITENIRAFKCKKCIYAQTLKNHGRISNEQYQAIFG
jgi:hypothetical protein